MSASAITNKYSLAAKKAWETIRKKRLEKIKAEYASIEDFFNFNMNIVMMGNYHISYPLVRKSKLAPKEKGGIGKDLSEGWAINFAVGCTHACIFCYADIIHKRVYSNKLGFSGIPWGFYFFKPENIDDAIEKTNWYRWKGKEVLMSSTHDPYLPQLYPIPRKILEHALPAGVKFCIQTRSTLVLKDLDLLSKYKNQIRLQVSIATMDENFRRKIEPRVSPTKARLRIIQEAKKYGIDVGVIIAPIFPPVKLRPNLYEDLENIITALSEIKPDHIFGEMLHARGSNLTMIEAIIGETLTWKDIIKWDLKIEKMFYKLLSKYNLHGIYWREHYSKFNKQLSLKIESYLE